jgi:hypothetical protein
VPPAKEGLASGTFLLNGKPCFLRGTNTSGGLNCYSYWGQTKELLNALLLLKAANFNITRVNQHVDFPEVREMMDRLGIMSEQDQGGNPPREGLRREQHIHTGTVLARETYNNPGVVLLSFANECDFKTDPILRAALAVDPQRIFKPISGRYSSGWTPWSVSEDLRTNAVDDGHLYPGWYSKIFPQTWNNLKIFSPRRLVTLGEFGGEALDAYETMSEHYPSNIKPPAPGTDTLWAAAQVKKHDVKQTVGLGRDPKNLGSISRRAKIIRRHCSPTRPPRCVSRRMPSPATSSFTSSMWCRLTGRKPSSATTSAPRKPSMPWLKSTNRWSPSRN